jgi:hypothetical protein
VSPLRRAGVAIAAGLALVVAGAGAAGGASNGQQRYAAACRAAGTLVAATSRAPAVVPVVARGALPPTPLPVVLGAANTAVVARVVAVLYQGPKPSTPSRPPGFVGPIPPSRCQVVRLAVTQLLRGAPPPVLVVVKPKAPYSLSTSRRPHSGTFLLDGSAPYPSILGNYGPAPYAPADVAAALAQCNVSVRCGR